jgi:hypothetical protein
VATVQTDSTPEIFTTPSANHLNESSFWVGFVPVSFVGVFTLLVSEAFLSLVGEELPVVAECSVFLVELDEEEETGLDEQPRVQARANETATPRSGYFFTGGASSRDHGSGAGHNRPTDGHPARHETSRQRLSRQRR